MATVIDQIVAFPPTQKKSSAVRASETAVPLGGGTVDEVVGLIQEDICTSMGCECRRTENANHDCVIVSSEVHDPPPLQAIKEHRAGFFLTGPCYFFAKCVPIKHTGCVGPGEWDFVADDGRMDVRIEMTRPASSPTDTLTSHYDFVQRVVVDN